jgi:ADP-ribose pyrophosphatase YjhB (NUDIX family)
VTEKPWRNGVRALVLDANDRVLLVHFTFDPYPWAPPGGGIDPGESDEHALRRELAEEVGLDEFELGPLLWTREHEFDRPVRFRGQRERCYLVRVDPFEPEPRLDLEAELVSEVRWWTQHELALSTEVFAPRSLPACADTRTARARPASRAPRAREVSPHSPPWVGKKNHPPPAVSVPRKCARDTHRFVTDA